MLRQYSWYWTKFFQGVDVAIVVVAWILSQIWLTQRYQFVVVDNLVTIGLLVAGWGFVARLFSLYQSKRLITWREEAKVLTLIVILYTLLINLFAFFQPMELPMELGSLFLFGMLVWLGVSGFHGVLRIGLRTIRARGFNQRRVLIYGAGRMGRQMVSDLWAKPQLGMKVVGFLDDGLGTQTSSGSTPVEVDCDGVHIPVLGTSHDVRQLILDNNIHDVITTLPSNAHDRLKSFVLEISDLPINVRVVPDLLDVISVQAHSEDIWDIPVIGVRQPSLDGIDALAKRVIDLAISGLALVFVSPIMLVIAILIKLDSGAPILFRQERSGLNGKPFTMYKFRTMVVDAEQQLDNLIKVDTLSQPMFKIHNDPRVTRIGRILRKTSLDELPQLFNVLRGEMSLVGPRPEELRIVRLYSYAQRQRLAVKPGLTGPMQVNGRGDLSFEDRLRLEINYIKNYSLYHDLELLIQTVPVVLLGKGAH
jgi:exopolysaccharide biosynthesis polyprenyl glycosylphosphotransferase